MSTVTLHSWKASNIALAKMGSLEKVSYVQYVAGHKNSKGELAPWVIKDHDDGHIISSHTTKDKAESHLRDMHIFGRRDITFRQLLAWKLQDEDFDSAADMEQQMYDDGVKDEEDESMYEGLFNSLEIAHESYIHDVLGGSIMTLMYDVGIDYIQSLLQDGRKVESRIDVDTGAITHHITPEDDHAE